MANTVGAGDALAAAFLRALTELEDPHRALEHAVAFAGWRVGVGRGEEGWCSWEELVNLTRREFPGGGGTVSV